MTHSPVVLVYIYDCKHVSSPLPKDIWAHEVCAIRAKTPSKNLPSISMTTPPQKPNRRASLGQTYVNVYIWIPRLLMVLSAIQSPRRPTCTTRRVWSPKFFILPGVDWCVTINSSLTCHHIPKPLLPFFCPSKPPFSASTNACMVSVQETHHSPHQIKVNTDSQKFLIDSGASAHLWNHLKDFISYCSLSPQGRKNDQVLAVSRQMVASQGIGSV